MFASGISKKTSLSKLSFAFVSLALPLLVRGCGWWLMGAFWGTLFQVAVAPVQWAMAKGHTIGKTVSYQMTAEAARLEIEDN